MIDKFTTFGFRTLTRIGCCNVMTFKDDDDQVQPNQNARILQLGNEFLRSRYFGHERGEMAR